MMLTRRNVDGDRVVKQQVNGKLLQNRTKDHCPSWKVTQGRELPLKTLFIPKAYGHSLSHGKALVHEAVGAALHAPFWAAGRVGS